MRGHSLSLLLLAILTLAPAAADHQLPMAGARGLHLTDLGTGAMVLPMAHATESSGHPPHHDNVVDEACHYFWILDNPSGNWCHQVLTQDEDTGHRCFLHPERSYKVRFDGLQVDSYYSAMLVYRLRPFYGMPANPVPFYAGGDLIGFGQAQYGGVLEFDADLAKYPLHTNPFDNVANAPVLAYFIVEGPGRTSSDTERTSFAFPLAPVSPLPGSDPAGPCIDPM